MVSTENKRQAAPNQPPDAAVLTDSARWHPRLIKQPPAVAVPGMPARGHRAPAALQAEAPPLEGVHSFRSFFATANPNDMAPTPFLAPSAHLDGLNIESGPFKAASEASIRVR